MRGHTPGDQPVVAQDRHPRAQGVGDDELTARERSVHVRPATEVADRGMPSSEVCRQAVISVVGSLASPALTRSRSSQLASVTPSR